jgi:hypothetical protein
LGHPVILEAIASVWDTAIVLVASSRECFDGLLKPGIGTPRQRDHLVPHADAAQVARRRTEVLAIR